MNSSRKKSEGPNPARKNIYSSDHCVTSNLERSFYSYRWLKNGRMPVNIDKSIRYDTKRKVLHILMDSANRHITLPLDSIKVIYSVCWKSYLCPLQTIWGRGRSSIWQKKRMFEYPWQLWNANNVQEWIYFDVSNRLKNLTSIQNSVHTQTII